MRMEEAFYNIYMYLYDKNVLEYAQITRSGPKSMIRNIQGLSNILTLLLSSPADVANKVWQIIITKPTTNERN